MNLFREQASTATLAVHGAATTVLTMFIKRAIIDSVVWLAIALVIILCDLYFGVLAAHRRGERVRFSRACRRTISKICEYLCWVVLAITLSIGFSVDWLKYVIFAIIYGNELSSCLSNYFESHGKRITFNIFALLGNKLGIKQLEEIKIEDSEDIAKGDRPD